MLPVSTEANPKGLKIIFKGSLDPWLQVPDLVCLPSRSHAERPTRQDLGDAPVQLHRWARWTVRAVYIRICPLFGPEIACARIPVTRRISLLSTQPPSVRQVELEGDTVRVFRCSGLSTTSLSVPIPFPHLPVLPSHPNLCHR